MKQTFILLSLTALMSFWRSPLSAQSIPNGDFETWSIVAGVEKPGSGWSLSDEAGLGCVPLSSVKTTDKAGGSYALLLETNDCINFGGIHEGWAQLIFSTSAKPDSVRFKYKATRAGMDSAQVDIWVKNHSTPIGHAQYYISNNETTYKEVSVPFQYFFPLSVTTIDIFITSDVGWNRAIGNRLLVDELRFTYPPTAIGNSYNNNLRLLSCSPVPAAAALNVSFGLITGSAVTITLRNMAGQAVCTVCSYHAAGNCTVPVDMSLLPKGIYLCEVQLADGEKAIERIIKQ